MLYVLLAAYNEEQNLPGMFADIQKERWPFDYRIIVVNDGSTDGTHRTAAAYTAQFPLTIIDHDRNQGLGAALRTGFSYLNSAMSDTDVAVVLDADNSHPIDTIRTMLNTIDSGCDLVIASRYNAGSGQKGLSVHRRLLSLGARLFLTLLWPIPHVTDYSCGFRMYRGSLIKALFATHGNACIEEHGFAATVEILLKASRLTQNIAEVPMVLRYDKKIGASKMRVCKTMARYFALLFRLRHI